MFLKHCVQGTEETKIIPGLADYPKQALPRTGTALSSTISTRGRR